MGDTQLFGAWSHFHLIMAGEKLDVYNFKIKNYGLSKQLVIEAVVLCHVDKVVKVMKSWNKATLVIHPPEQEPQYFHGVLMFDRSNLCNPPKDYLAFDIELETPFWCLTHTYTIDSYHRTDVSQFIANVIDASGIDESRFILGILPTIKRELRYANQTRWFEFISKQLALEKVYTRSNFDKDNETILFSNHLTEFTKKNEPRKLAIRLIEHMRRDLPNLFYDLTEEYNQVGLKTFLNTKVKCFETLAYPGELIQIGNTEFFVENNEISGSHNLKFDGGELVQNGEPTLISELNLIPIEQGLELEVKPEPDRGFSVFTGQMEADIFGEENIKREYSGTYNGRYDFDEEITELNEDVNPDVEPKGPMRIQALQELRVASLMGGYSHGVDLPLHDGTEILLTRPNGTDEPALVLGTLSNQRSGNLTTNSNRDDNIIRTWSGNQLKIVDGYNYQTLALETFDAQNSLNFDYQSGTVKLTTKQGEIDLEAATDFIIHTPATIILQTENNAKKLINNKLEQEAYEGIIRLETKGASYLTSVEDYNIEVRKVIIESQNHILFEAEDTIEIIADELQVLAENGDIEISADYITINANHFIATAPGASLEITDGLLELRASDKAIIDIEQAIHTANEHNLGGKPKEPLKNKIKSITDKVSNYAIENSFVREFGEGLAKQPLSNVQALLSTNAFKKTGQGISNIVADSIGTNRIPIKGAFLPGWIGTITAFTGASAAAYSENGISELDINKFSIDTGVNVAEGVAAGAAATWTIAKLRGVFVAGQIAEPAGGGFITVGSVLFVSGIYSLAADNFIGKKIKVYIYNEINIMREKSSFYNDAIVSTTDFYEWTANKWNKLW